MKRRQAKPSISFPFFAAPPAPPADFLVVRKWKGFTARLEGAPEARTRLVLEIGSRKREQFFTSQTIQTPFFGCLYGLTGDPIVWISELVSKRDYILSGIQSLEMVLAGTSASERI